MTTYVISGCHGEGRMHFMTGRRGRRHMRHFGAEPGFGRRAGRGDIRAAILALLAEEPMHGYQIIQELTERTGGVWRPSPGSVYPTLQQLEDEDLVRETASDSGKRVYELTDTGRQHASETTAPWTAVTDESDDAIVALRDLAHNVMAATRQVAHAGTAAQVEAAQQVLRDARRSLYRLLAGEE
jgi:DNA-binding PadR family transcriptional regulator